MGGACHLDGEEKEFIQNAAGKSSLEMTTWKTKKEVEDNIKLHLTEIGCEAGKWNWFRIVCSRELWY